MSRLAMLLALFLAGCASETVSLTNSRGDMVRCGPYRTFGNVNASAVTSQFKLRGCIEDFQRQGYERVAGE